MAKLMFEMNQSLDGYVDHMAFASPGLDVAHHWHSSAERMVLVSGELEIAYDGRSRVVLKPGMYAYGPAKRPHTAKCMQGESADCG